MKKGYESLKDEDDDSAARIERMDTDGAGGRGAECRHCDGDRPRDRRRQRSGVRTWPTGRGTVAAGFIPLAI